MGADELPKFEMYKLNAESIVIAWGVNNEMFEEEKVTGTVLNLPLFEIWTI